MSQKPSPSYTRPTNASQRRQPVRSAGKAPLSPPETNTSRETPSLSAPTTTTTKKNAPRVTDRNFREVTLPRYGIEVLEDAQFSTFGAYNHFGTQRAPEGDEDTLAQWYHEQQGSEDANVWLPLTQLDAQRVARQYALMVNADENEAKFSFHGKIDFFRQDVAPDPAKSDRSRQTYCKMEWAPMLSPERELHPPPVVDSGNPVADPPTRDFAFNNKPDLTFWLPLLLFNTMYRSHVDMLTYVIPKARVAAPYLTVEFKKDDEDFASAVNQLAAAAALILYNRFRLRLRRLQQWKCGSLGKDVFAGLAHYGVAFTANVAQIYKAEPKLALDGASTASVSDLDNSGNTKTRIWAGCTLRRLKRIEIAGPEHVIELRTWINEIQNWGLRTYANDFSFDVRAYLYRLEGGSDRVSLLPHEMQQLKLLDPHFETAT